MQTHEHDLKTIAAFIDGERVDPHALKSALTHDQGRDYLVELVAIRELMATPTMTVAAPKPTGPTRAWWIVSAAAVLLAIAGGIAVGTTTATHFAMTASKSAPAATVVVTTDGGWRETKGGN